jgi:hypothetical protein
MLPRNKREKKRVVRMRVKEEDKVVSISHSMVLQYVHTLLDYIGQRGFKYRNIRDARKIHTAVRTSLNSSKSKQPLQTISQNKHQLYKRM